MLPQLRSSVSDSGSIRMELLWRRSIQRLQHEQCGLGPWSPGQGAADEQAQPNPAWQQWKRWEPDGGKERERESAPERERERERATKAKMRNRKRTLKENEKGN